MESFLETLHRCGFTDAGCVGAYRAFSSFLLGHLLLEVSAQGADVGPIEQADPDDKPTTDLSQYPRLKSLEPELSQDHSADEFDEALETLLDRIDLLDHHRTRRHRRTDNRQHSRNPGTANNPPMRSNHGSGNNDSTPTGRRQRRKADHDRRIPLHHHHPRRATGYPGTAAARSRTSMDTVQRIMGEDIAPPTPGHAAHPATQRRLSRTVTTPPPPRSPKQQAAEVADTAKQAGAQVADTVKEQAGQVTAEAKQSGQTAARPRPSRS